MAGNGGIIGPVNTIQSQCEVTHTKTAGATITTQPLTSSVNALLVAGGGGAGAAGSGGGGGGGYLCTSISVCGNTAYPLVIGGGGEGNRRVPWTTARGAVRLWFHVIAKALAQNVSSRVGSEEIEQFFQALVMFL